MLNVCFLVPDPVRDLHIEEHGITYALLKWLPPEEPNGKLLGYDIGYQQSMLLFLFTFFNAWRGTLGPPPQ